MKPNHIINEVYCIKSELKVVFTSGTLHRNITLKSKLNWSSMVTFLWKFKEYSICISGS